MTSSHFVYLVFTKDPAKRTQHFNRTKKCNIVGSCCEGAGQTHATQCNMLRTTCCTKKKLKLRFKQLHATQCNMLRTTCCTRLATLLQFVAWFFEITNRTSAHAPVQYSCKNVAKRIQQHPKISTFSNLIQHHPTCYNILQLGQAKRVQHVVGNNTWLCCVENSCCVRLAGP